MVKTRVRSYVGEFALFLLLALPVAIASTEDGQGDEFTRALPQLSENATPVVVKTPEPECVGCYQTALEMTEEVFSEVYDALKSQKILPIRRLGKTIIVASDCQVDFPGWGCTAGTAVDSLPYLPGAMLAELDISKIDDHFKKITDSLKDSDLSSEYIFTGCNERGNATYYLAAKFVDYRKKNTQPLLVNQIKVLTFFSQKPSINVEKEEYHSLILRRNIISFTNSLSSFQCLGVTVERHEWCSPPLFSKSFALCAFKRLKNQWEFRQHAFDNGTYKDEEELIDNIGKISFWDPQENRLSRFCLSFSGGY